MHLIQYRQAMALVRLAPDSPDPTWAVGAPLVSISRTTDEISVVCPTNSLPEPVPGPVEGPFTVTRAAGALEFSQIGVLLRLLKPLADAGIPVLNVSTFDTDWVLVPAAQSVVAASVWRHAGYTVTEDAE
ncbi:MULTISPECIES: ACT domain-containing protein [Kineosporia]|uniref:ACT domain-containing protein n=1 Tax=Kineosporia mesophila TaxID=566012 RepID=A0ABP7A841_9ACTN|nr:ACT domain-containing protein [Kineosporia sp. NBRC 101731]MCD5351686.1 ACT domain-containing protein [Kineosporia mesophila]GLY33711.1 amino acid-binding protein [Kineosporia sp. NBRC 101731]